MPSYEEVETKIRDLLVNFTGKDPGRISVSSDLVADGTIDSLTTVNMILACEEEFEVTVYPDEARDLLTVALIARHIHERLPT